MLIRLRITTELVTFIASTTAVRGKTSIPTPQASLVFFLKPQTLTCDIGRAVYKQRLHQILNVYVSKNFGVHWSQLSQVILVFKTVQPLSRL